MANNGRIKIRNNIGSKTTISEIVLLDKIITK